MTGASLNVSFTQKSLRTSFSTIANAWAYVVIETLFQLGITTYFIAPGARSTPLTLEVASRPELEVHTHFDERSLGFMALGFAKHSKKLPCVITTSGTAVANLYPSMIEGTLSEIPLLVLSADRPTHLINVGANQAIDQVDIFGRYAASFVDLGNPDPDVSIDTVVSALLDSIKTGLIMSKPIHVNARFDEPFTPSPTVLSFSDYFKPLHDYNKSINIDILSNNRQKGDDYRTIINLINNSNYPLLFISEGDDYLQSFSKELAARLHSPVFTDGTSPLHYSSFESHIRFGEVVLDHSASLLPLVDCVIWVGDHLVSKPYLQWLTNVECPIIHISGLKTTPNPLLKPIYSLFGDPLSLKAILNECSLKRPPSVHSLTLNAIEKDLEDAFFSTVPASIQLTEWTAAYWVTQYSSHLFVGNSLPIRACHAAGSWSGPLRHLGLNRGASGIDGLVSTAIGMAIGLDKMITDGLTLLVGDMSALYDLNAFYLLRTCLTPIRIIVINNNGGGIFSFLPVNDGSAQFETYFTMPTHTQFASIATAIGCRYEKVTTLSHLTSVLSEPISSHCLIEVVVSISDTLESASQLNSRLSTVIQTKLD